MEKSTEKLTASHYAVRISRAQFFNYFYFTLVHHPKQKYSALVRLFFSIFVYIHAVLNLCVCFKLYYF